MHCYLNFVTFKVVIHHVLMYEAGTDMRRATSMLHSLLTVLGDCSKGHWQNNQTMFVYCMRTIEHLLLNQHNLCQYKVGKTAAGVLF